LIWHCIRCYKTWGDKLDNDGFMSSGLCKDCARDLLFDLYRRRQRENPSAWECFGTAEYECDQLSCEFRKICLKDKEE